MSKARTLADSVSTGGVLADGAVTLSGGTVNGVGYLNASKVLTAGSALTFNGTNLATTGSATAASFIPSSSTIPTNGMYLPASNTIAWSTGSVEVMRLNVYRNLLLGTTTGVGTNNDRLQIHAAAATSRAAVFKNITAASETTVIWNDSTTGDNAFVSFNTETSITARGSIDYNRAGGLTRYNTTSDYRAKDIIGPVQSPGATIDALKVYEGVMKGATQSRPMLIAHEAQAHAPYAVSGFRDEVNEDGSPKYQQMDVSALVPLLLAEIQSLRARVAALEVA